MANTLRRAPSRFAPTFTLLFAGMVAGVLVGLVALLPSTIAHRSTSTALDDASPPISFAVAAPAPAPPPAPTVLGASALAEDVTPSVELQGVPSSAIDREQTLVTFLPVADGERVLVDGHAVTTADPTKMRCGKHTIRIGAGVKRKVSFPCGGALTLD